MKTRSQTAPKPLKTVALAPRPGSPKRRPRPKPKPKPAGKGDPRAPKKPPTAFFYFMYVPRCVCASSPPFCH